MKCNTSIYDDEGMILCFFDFFDESWIITKWNNSYLI